MAQARLDNLNKSRSSIEDRLDTVGGALLAAFRDTLVQIPGSPHRPQELARQLGIKKDLSSRVVRACGSHDPITVIHGMPGPAPLREFLAAAADSVNPDTLRRAQSAVRDFERLIYDFAGDRTSLDGIISGWLPEVREKFEIFNKQAVYRGMAQLKGCAADVAVNTAILHPSPDGLSLDGVWIMGFVGLRRIRPETVVYLTSKRISGPETTTTPLTLTRTPSLDIEGLLLHSHCSSPLPRIRAEQFGSITHYSLGGDDIGPSSAVNLMLGELTEGCMHRYRSPDKPLTGPSAAVSTPVKAMLLDVILHKDAYPGCDPRIVVVDTAINGEVRLNDPALRVESTGHPHDLRPLGQGLTHLRTPLVPNYPELIHSALDTLGWPIADFHGYRLDAQYPVYGTETYVAFHPPQAPESQGE